MNVASPFKGHELDELTKDDIDIYVASLSQYHKIFLHRTLAHWRNITVDNVTSSLRKGWSAWLHFIKMHYRAETRLVRSAYFSWPCHE